MKLRREAAILKAKALASMRRATGAFNAHDDVGRVTTVLLHTQHSFEMLLKAALVQRRVKVFDVRTARSIGFERCVNLATQHLKLSDAEAGTIRALDAMRDDEQHWITECSEALLYLHVRGAVTLIEDLLQRWFKERLADHWPQRTLPVSADPPRDLQLLIDEEYSAIRKLLAPRTRRRPDARARIRSLLALEAHVSEDVGVSENDVDRVERGIRSGAARGTVFPRLASIGTELGGEGLLVTVRFTKKDGIPVQFVSADDPTEAAAVREVDLQRKYHWTKHDLAAKVGLTSPRSLALRRHLGIEEDDDCRHDFVFGSQTHRRYSDNAYKKMKEAIAGGVDMEAVWKANGPSRRRAKAVQRRNAGE